MAKPAQTIAMSERLKNYGALPETQPFFKIERESDILFKQMSDLGIWKGMEANNRLEPAVRCANLASRAAIRMNELSSQTGSDPIVSPKVTFLVGLLFKAGQVIDDQVVADYHLDELDPRILNLYKYPAYAPERTIHTSNVLKLSLLLHRLDHPKFAELVLHGPHPKFFEEAELPNVLVSLANANLALNEENNWRSYVHPGVGLLAIPSFAQRSDQLPPTQAKDFVDRVRMVAINSTLQHIFRMKADISFTDKEYVLDKAELRQRWMVVHEVFKQLGLPFPTRADLEIQNKHAIMLEKWMKKHDVVSRLEQKQKTSKYLLYDHSRMVAELLEHLGKQVNGIARQLGEEPILDEKYLYLIGICHDSIKAFDASELEWLQELKRSEKEFEHTYPPEVVARGNVSLATSHDAQLYAWLKHFEEGTLTAEERDRIPSLANDFLSGPYHLTSFVSALLSYADLAVIDRNDGKGVQYKPDITERFLNTTMKYISDPHVAVIGYAKLMTVAASISWYLGTPLPVEGSERIGPENLALLDPEPVDDSYAAIRNLGNISRVLRIFGVAVPKELRKFEGLESQQQSVL